MTTIPLYKVNDIQETSSNQLSDNNYGEIFSYSNGNVNLKSLPLVFCQHIGPLELKCVGS